MNNVVKLQHAMIHCPTAWINFFESCCIDGPRDDKGDVTVEYINRALNPWHCKYDEATTSLVFETEGAMAWFYLKWV